MMYLWDTPVELELQANEKRAKRRSLMSTVLKIGISRDFPRRDKIPRLRRRERLGCVILQCRTMPVLSFLLSLRDLISNKR